MYWSESGDLTQAGQALVASFLAGMASGLGGLMALVRPALFRRIYHTLLGFSAGVMLAAAALTLLLPALRNGSLAAVALGLFCGGALIVGLDRALPHLEPHFAPRFEGREARFGLLLLAAMALHNLPEGLSVGVAYAHGDGRLGMIVALAIAAQNIPEGVAVALPLRAAGAGRLEALLWSVGSGLVEPVAAAAGYHGVSAVAGVVPFALAAAAGAMVFVVSDQLIPEARSERRDMKPSIALLAGFFLVGALLKVLG